MDRHLLKSIISPLYFIISAMIVFSLASPLLAAEKKKIIFDTDIAGDIDDAFAQALVMVSSEFEVLGITVADGPTPQRAAVSCRILYECGLEKIPVYVGRPTRGAKATAPQLVWGNGLTIEMLSVHGSSKAAADAIGKVNGDPNAGADQPFDIHHISILGCNAREWYQGENK